MTRWNIFFGPAASAIIGLCDLQRGTPVDPSGCKTKHPTVLGQETTAGRACLDVQLKEK